MFKCIATAAAIALTTATPAMARNDERPFQGFNIHAGAGIDNIQSGGKSPGDFVYGVGIGYDLQRGSMVFGVELEGDQSNYRQCTSDDTGQLCLKARGKKTGEGYIGGRLGVAMSDKLLLYVKAGFEDIVLQESLTPPPGSTDGVTKKRRQLDGARVGIGAEYRISGGLFVRAEYRYTDYERGFTRNQGLLSFGYRF